MMFLIPGQRRRLLSNRKRLGNWGEKHCEKFLKNQGYAFVARNFACKSGEVDLIMCSDEGALVFVEVKTRRSEKFAAAQTAVNYKKRKKMVSTARWFANQYDLKDKPMRFDVMAVVVGEKGPVEVRHYKNAFIP
jgi:putative endonuclease